MTYEPSPFTVPPGYDYEMDFSCWWGWVRWETAPVAQGHTKAECCRIIRDHYQATRGRKDVSDNG